MQRLSATRLKSEEKDWVMINQEREAKSTLPADKNQLLETMISSLMTFNQCIDKLKENESPWVDPKAIPSAEDMSVTNLAANPLIFLHFMKMTHVLLELLKPDPKPLSDEAKDNKVYEDLLAKLADKKPLRDLIKHIHTRSTFLKVGQDVGINLPESKEYIEISVATFNGAWLPSLDVFGKTLLQVNGDRLRSNLQRSQEAVEFFCDFFNYIRPLDLCFFEEAFDKKVREFLIEEFNKMGFAHIGDEGEKYLSAGSGLLGFYKKNKFTLCDTLFEAYTRKLLGPETLANKGILGAKFLISHRERKYFFTTISTHETTASILPHEDKKHGTSSDIRGYESQLMRAMAKNWGMEPITDPDTGNIVPHLGTFYSGDVNKTLNLPYQLMSMSTGASSNHFELADIKYAGDHNLGMDLLSVPKSCWPIPKNSSWILNPKSTRSNSKKPADLGKEIRAKVENLATGSSIPQSYLKSNKQQNGKLTLQTTEHRLIDLLAMVPNQAVLNAFESYIVLTVNRAGQAISDHFLLWAVALITPPVNLKCQKNVAGSDEQLKPKVADKKSHLFFSGHEKKPEDKAIPIINRYCSRC